MDKNIGNSSLGLAIAYFTCHNYIVSIPINDTQDLLFIATKNRDLYLISINNLRNTYTLNLGREYKKYLLTL